jgi:hypothetical protein
VQPPPAKYKKIDANCYGNGAAHFDLEEHILQSR